MLSLILALAINSCNQSTQKLLGCSSSRAHSRPYAIPCYLSSSSSTIHLREVYEDNYSQCLVQFMEVYEDKYSQSLVQFMEVYEDNYSQSLVQFMEVYEDKYSQSCSRSSFYFNRNW